MPARAVNLYKEDYDVYCGRRQGQGYFGNPFPLLTDTPEEREACLKRFREYFLERVEEDATFRQRVLALHGKRLGCFCKPKACHADVIAEWVNEHTEVDCVADRIQGR